MIQTLFQSNEEMLEYDPNDYDLIQAREDNLILIDKKLEEMKKIQEKMKEQCHYHPIVNVNVFEYFAIGKKTKDEDVKNEKENENDKNNNIIKVNEENIINENNINSINDLEDKKESNSTNKDDKKQNNDNLVTEIEL